MEIDPNVDSMEGSSDSGPETLENSSSIGKEKISKKGIRKRILSFSQIVDHTGDSIGKCIENVLIEWGIDKVFTITVDNATANTTAIGYVIRKLNSSQDGGAVLEGNASLRVTSNIYFKSWCTIRNQLNSLTFERDPLVSKIAVSMQQKFDKYWGGLEKTNNLLIVAVVLDPRYKLGYVKFRFDSIYGVEESQLMISKVKGVLLDLYEWYNKFYGSLGEGAKETDVFSIGVGGEASDDLELGRLKATDKEDSLWGMKQQEEDINKGKKYESGVTNEGGGMINEAMKSGLVCFHSLPYWSASVAAAIPLLRRSCSIAGLVWIAHPSFAATVPLLFH
ncbi:hypothetical protein LWI29_000671 [Acer saccharum]|uniref:hAT-like transposase RNase-H fold domain-containing protein n=1 Tax=Acer saccharum TaxID=4024 RepID=A0AA39SQ62_ACESA|nr:hypothetical protein LWI29_000671 [Acer saccharum]